jgi:hypothetical protein
MTLSALNVASALCRLRSRAADYDRRLKSNPRDFNTLPRRSRGGMAIATHSLPAAAVAQFVCNG